MHSSNPINSLFASRTQAISSDKIDIIFDKVEKLKQSGTEIINLGVGQPHLGVFELMTNKIGELKQIRDTKQQYGYADLQGEPAALKAICRLFNSEYQSCQFSPPHVLVTTGATQGAYTTFSTFLDLDDKVLAFEPCYSAYRSQIAEFGAELILIPTIHRQFRPCAELLRYALIRNPKTKMLILNFPNNPTGIDLTREELFEIAAVLKKYNQVVIVEDRVYSSLTRLPHHNLLDIDPEAFKDRYIAIDSGSKRFGWPALRLGYLGCLNELVIQRMVIQQAKVTSSQAASIQDALIAAAYVLENEPKAYEAWEEKCKQTYFENMKLITRHLKSLNFNIINGGNGLFVFASASFLIGKEIPDTFCFKTPDGKLVNIDGIKEKIQASTFKSDDDIANFFLYTIGVAIIPGSAFGIESHMGYFRFSCATSPDNITNAFLLISQAIDAILKPEMKKTFSIESDEIGVSEKGMFGQSKLVQVTSPPTFCSSLMKPTNTG